MNIRFAALVVAAAKLMAQPSVAAWDVLKHDLSDSNPEKRKQAVLAVASIGPAPEVTAVLDEFLRDKDVQVRQTAAAVIGQEKYRDSIPALRAALDDEPEVAVQAAKSLWAMGDRSGRNVLERLYTGEEKGGPGFFESAMRDAKDKLHNPRKLVTMGINEASGALLGPFSLGVLAAEGFMKDTGAPGRAIAASVLAEDCNARAAQLMEWSLANDRSKFVRAASAKGLGRCGNISTIPKLMLLLTEDNAGIRDMAAASIVRLTIEKVPKETVATQ